MCKLTSYICRVKENPQLQEVEGYYLKMKNALEGGSVLKSSAYLIYVKTLTGKTIEIETSLEINVEDLKDLVQ